MDDVVYFGKTNFRNAQRTFGIKATDRRQHTYIIGKTGTGKTALITNIALQDIKNGKGLCIIDPHGELVESILPRIPPERVNDIIYFNPEDTEYPIGFNVLEVTDPSYKHLIASDLMGIFTKIWANVWSARMEYILNNCVLALIDTPGTTLLGITRILVDKNYREKIIANVKDPVVRSFWLQEYESWRDQFRNEAIVPIQNKVGQFLSTALIRNIISQPKSTMNIQNIMDTNKILLVNVSKGRIGEDNSALLGAMLITKIQLAAMARVKIPEEERQDFYLYVDEFQNFATESFAGILSEARKYRLNLIVVHQYIGQLVSKESTQIRDAIFGNVGTIIVFRVGATDAEFLENEFTPEFEIQDIVNLPNYHIYLKLMVNGVTSRPFSAMTLPPFSLTTLAENKETIMANSRKLYSKKRAEVEKEINDWSSSSDSSFNSNNPSSGNYSGDRGSSNSQGSFNKFQATCSSCNKPTQISFQPDGIRPVYCDDCFKKLKSGEIQPIKPRRNRPIKSQSSYENDLAKVGIEFSIEPPRPPRPTQTRPEEFEERPKSYPPRPLPNNKDDSRPRSFPQPLGERTGFTSLKDLKK